MVRPLHCKNRGVIDLNPCDCYVCVPSPVERRAETVQIPLKLRIKQELANNPMLFEEPVNEFLCRPVPSVSEVVQIETEFVYANHEVVYSNDDIHHDTQRSPSTPLPARTALAALSMPNVKKSRKKRGKPKRTQHPRLTKTYCGNLIRRYFNKGDDWDFSFHDLAG